MTIARTIYPERILIVLDPSGALKGAHVERLETLSEDGEALQTRQLPAAALDAETLASSLPGQAALLAQVQSLTDALSAAETARDAAVIEKEAAVTAKDAAVAAAEAQAAILNAQIAALNAQLHPTDGNGFAVLSPVQLRLGLLSAGIRTSHIMTIINAIPNEIERERAFTYWDYTLQYHRDHPLIAQFAGALGLTREQVDAMWTAAAQV